MLSTWFRNDLMGLPGDEDGGGMSSFVVFSAIGIYPVTPGSLEYAIGSPLFEKVSMTLSNGKTFTVLDGKQLSRPFIKHSDIMAGCTLELEMTDKPCMGFSETTE